MTFVSSPDLRQLLTSGAKALWAGDMPPIPGVHPAPALYDPALDYRMPPAAHQQYDVVYLVERDLGREKAWPQIIDEALRLLAPLGILLVRMTNTPLCSIFALKHQIQAFGGMEAVGEFTCDDGAIEFMVRNTRAAPRDVVIRGLSIGVITDGKRKTQLDRFIESICALQPVDGVAVELIVCAPPHVEAEVRARVPSLVFVPDHGDFASLGWITRKKNQIVAAASHENLLIAHDRYTLHPNVVRELVSYGGDWSVLVCRQEQPDGRRFPDWVTLGSAWSWSSPAMLEYGDWTPHVYVNGGITIAKRDALQQVPWNDLLFWNQAEDVELSRRLMHAGYIPRLARRVIAVSHVMRAGTMEAFEPLPAVSDRYLLPGPFGATGEAVTPSVPYGQPLFLGTRAANEVARQGVFRCEQWMRTGNAISLPAGRIGEIGFRLPDVPTRPVVIVFSLTDAAPTLQITVNDLSQTVERLTPGVVRVVVPPEQWAKSRVTRVHVQVSKGTVSLEALQVEPSGWTLRSALPVTRELAVAFATGVTSAPGVDASTLCLSDVKSLLRGARRVAVFLPSSLPATMQLARFMASLRTYVRADTAVRVIGEPGLHALYDGFEPFTVDWQRYGTDRAYLLDRNSALSAFEPDVIINACAPRPFLSDIMILECKQGVAIGFAEAGYELKDDAADYIRPRYRQLLADDGDPSSSLIDALGVSAAPAMLWPDAVSVAAASAKLSGIASDQPVLAVLGDNASLLSMPDFALALRGFVEQGWMLVGIGGPETYAALQRVLTPFGTAARNCAEPLPVPVVFSLLQHCEAYLGGTPNLARLAEIAGCADALAVLERDAASDPMVASTGGVA